MTAPRWYAKGDIITDEVGTFTLPAPEAGWYIVENHYGNIRVIPVPVLPDA